MKAFVTGGGGFLGKAIIRLLRIEGYEVVSYSRGHYPDIEALGAKHFSGDLSNFEKLKDAMLGCDIVFHVAAKAGFWGEYNEFYNANVIGTENVIKACKELNINKLVYTSSPSVVHTGQNIEGRDESMPYPSKFEAYYPETKAIAEKKVIQANDETLATVSLRPHLIWGPEDHHFLPRFIERAKAGRLKLIGEGNNLVDCVYVDNAAKAHLLAAEKLYPKSNISGKVYFITQGQPIKISDFINNMLRAANLPPVTAKIPFNIAFTIGTVLEFVYKFFDIKKEPLMTKFLATQLATSHWFDITAAKRDLGYVPEISIDEGVSLLADWIKKNPSLH